jgi:septal ring factor EnvC (AmiA/AmiB activator)
MILEPADSYLLVLAGLGTVFGETGDVLDAGAPVGLMPGETGVSTPVPAGGEPDAGVSRSETLYMELRQRTEPIDPGPWFVETKDD